MKKLRLGEFERNSLAVFAITMIANVLSYLYQIVMGNVLPPADYGTVNTLLSLSVVVGVPSGIISALTATYTAKYHAHGETFAIAAFMHGMLRVAAVLAALLADRRLLRRVDYSLLLTFLFFFVFVGNMKVLPTVSEALSGLVAGREMTVGILLSQVISNVPAAMLLSGFTADYPALEALFKKSLEELYGQMAGQVKKNEHKDIQKVTDYIAAHYRENLTLEVLAKHIHMNPFYFSSYFKKQLGQNFKDYLNRVRMEHALELLLNSDKRSYEIAEEVGFKDYRYFNEVFSRYYGKTPAAYRKSFKEQNNG